MNTCFSPLELSSAAGGGCGPRSLCLEFAQPGRLRSTIVFLDGLFYLFFDKMGRLFLDKWAKIWQSEFASGSAYRASSRASFHKPGSGSRVAMLKGLQT